MTDEVAKSFAYDFSFYSTFGWHPRNVAAALANLRYIRKHCKALLENTSKMSDYFVNRLQKMRFQYPYMIRAKGLAIGVRFSEKDYARAIVNKCRERRLLFDVIDPYTFTFFPALNIDKATAQKGLDILEKCA